MKTLCLILTAAAGAWAQTYSGPNGTTIQISQEPHGASYRATDGRGGISSGQILDARSGAAIIPNPVFIPGTTAPASYNRPDPVENDKLATSGPGCAQLQPVPVIMLEARPVPWVPCPSYPHEFWAWCFDHHYLKRGQNARISELELLHKIWGDLKK